MDFRMKLSTLIGRACVASGAATLLLFGSVSPAVSEPAGKRKAKVSSAIAIVYPTENNAVKGTVRYTTTSEGMKIKAEISGLPPGKHGFHIHEYGDCSEPDAISAGDHFSPTNTSHGKPGDKEHHLGDMGNIEADAQGNALFELVHQKMSFKGQNSILGRAVIIHEKPDLFTQPTGDAGARIACGVIGIEGDIG